MPSAVVQGASDKDGNKWVSLVFREAWTVQMTPDGTTVEILLAEADARAIAHAVRQACGQRIETARAPLAVPSAWRK